MKVNRVLYALWIALAFGALLIAQTPINMIKIAGTNIATAAAGIIKVGITDSTGTTIGSTGNALDINIKSGANAGGTSQNDNTAFTYGTTPETPAGGVYNSTITAVTNGRSGAFAMTTKRALFTTPVDSGDTDMTNTSEHALNAHVTNGSATSTDAATQTAGTTNMALVESFALKYSGASYARVYGDPCELNAASYQTISQTAGTRLMTGTSAKKIYICAFQIVTATAQNIALVEGTGTVCATSTAGVMGGATAATGWNFAANGGLTFGAGLSALAAEATNADDLCLLQSGSGQVSGNLKYVVQ